MRALSYHSAAERLLATVGPGEGDHSFRKRPVVVEVVAFAAYVLVFAFALRLLNPILLRYDDAWFMLVSYSWLNGLSFTNHWVDPISSGVYNWHGFLQPLLLASLAPCGSFTCLNLVLVALGLVWLALWFVAVNLCTNHVLLRCALYVIGVGSVLQYSARPELLASLALLCILVVYVRCAGSPRYWIRAGLTGGLLGVVAVTSPAAAVLVCVGAAAVVGYLWRDSRNVTSFVLEGALVAGSSILSAILLLLAAYPLEAAVWIEGMREHAQVNADRSDTTGFLRYYLATKMYPLQGVMFMPLAALALWTGVAVWKGGNRMLFVAFFLSSAAFCYFLYYSAIRIPAAFYNFSFLVPVISLLAVAVARCNARSHVRGALVVPVFVFALACGAAQVFWAAQKVYSAPERQELTQGISRAVDDGLAAGVSIAMDPPLAVAIDDAQKLKQIDLLFFGRPGKRPQEPLRVQLLLRAQTELGTLPDEVPGFRLVEEAFLDSPLVAFVKPEGLYYAVYEAEPAVTGADSRAGQL